MTQSAPADAVDAVLAEHADLERQLSDPELHGDAANARMTRAATMVRDRIEPAWGRLDNRLYLLPTDRCQGFVEELRGIIPVGWQNYPLDQKPTDAKLVGFNKGKRIVIYLWLTGVSRDGCALNILHN